MPGRFAYPDPEEFAPTAEEIADAKTAASAQQNDSTAGSTIGGILGALAGGTLGTIIEPGGGTLAGAGLGAGLGSSVGNWIGGQVGSADANSADERGRLAAMKRQKKLTRLQMREQAFNDLMNEA